MNRLLKIAPCLVSLLLPLAAQAETQPAAPAADGTVPRIATVDWTIAETLLALGVTPLAMGMWSPIAPGSGSRHCRWM